MAESDSSVTLGLDLGPNSIGWALIDESRKEIIATGVRVFPEGVDRDQQGGEKSKSQTRRTARGMRRQIARRARRKRQLQELLIRHGLLPGDAAELQQLMELNPYPLRAMARRKQLEPFEIGRILCHLNQRRGFLSNRKTDRGDQEVKGMLAEIGELSETLRQNDQTLGEYLAQLDSSFTSISNDGSERVRRRHTRREMYINEFEHLWNEQRKHHTEILTDELRTRLYDPSPNEKWVCRGLIFGQRRVYWPKRVIGRCDLERNKPRCARALLAAQRFRIYQEVNNLRILDRSTGEERRLTSDEQQTLYAYLDTAKQRTFDQMRKKLKFTDAVQFNFERGGRKKLQGNETAAALASTKRIGKHWLTLDPETQDDIVDALINEDLEEEAIRRLVNDCGLALEEAQRALGAHLPDGHMNFSIEAIERLIPHLQRGLYLMANDPNDSAIHAAGYLRPDEREVKQHDYLPPAPDLPNPIVRQALIEARKVVNAVLRDYIYRAGRPLDEIRVELAREAKKSFEQRREIRFEQADRRKAREEAREKIEALGIKPTRSSIQRYLLWKEQEELCPYSQTKIGLAELFTPEVDIDHILPRWRSLDDSMANKVVCRRTENDAKQDRTPHEWLAEADPDKYDRVLRIADKLPGNKPIKFRQKQVALEDFVARQFTDTAYISRCVTEYLRSVGVRVRTTKGNLTADLRHWWGLNNILDPENRSRKMRNDHRHHAVDALVIALMTPKRVHAMANARGENMPQPWRGFLEQASASVHDVNVSNRVQRRVSGAIHEATFYGPTEAKQTYVRRKHVTELINSKHLAKVRDETIRSILVDHLRKQGVDASKPGAIPKTAFKGDNEPRMPSGVPIKRVRMLESSDTFRAVSEKRGYQFVKPGNNHHIVYRAIGDHEDEKWTAEVVTMWDVALRAKQGKPPVIQSDTNDGRFVMSLALGECFEIDDQDGGRLLCVVRKLDQRSKRLHYRVHTDAREAGDINKDNLYLSPQKMKQLNAAKVTVDPLGRIRRAGD